MRSFNILSNYVLLLSILVGMTLSGLVGYSFYQNETLAIELDFKRDVDDKAAALERELLINLEVLYAVKGLFDSSDNVTEIEFKKLASSFLVRHQNIQALEWIPRVSDDERETFEALKRQKYPDFEFTEREFQGSMVKAAKRSEYFPVYYVEPLEGNEVAVGFDLASNPKRETIIDKSRDLDLSLATASITLVQEVSNQKGFLVFMPTYEGTPTTLVKRREKLRGFVLGVYRIGDMFETAIKYTDVQGINLKLIDNTAIKAEELYINFSPEQVQDNTQLHLTYSKPLRRFGGRQWTLVTSPTLGYIAERRSLVPFLISALGMLFVLLGACYIYAITRRSSLISIEVEDRTKALNEASLALEELSYTDSLTSIANRRRFDQQLSKEWQRAIRGNTRLSLIVIDIDNFKLFNDQYGHLAGEQCLIDVSKALSCTTSRNTDLVARYGGEEFVILLPNTNESALLADKCRMNIEKLRIPHEPSSVSEFVTISIGAISTFPTLNCDPIAFTAKADRLLYQAKELGKNRVCVEDLPISKTGDVIDFKAPQK
ncbi:diguanylate cyclase [Shewanella eurypsychrophilus]|uniref:diguanylate cyclase n=1 Tax=Shewanella eurypsychrophilus TaxID=2593656 RepID=A0ABX6VA20_9GAMM|nr:MULTISPECIES: CHASE domain-containing protein [Shewanella]QFU24304.1 diguanylate cyclase [Shewanella sp. YLB-09]QPG59504.1 diguanylate cyclase [Shewanella eurypsychrophilus]